MRRSERLLNEYYLWLLGKVDCTDYDVEEYSELLYQLFNTDFTWTIQIDSNRASDGLNLRYEYVHVAGGAPCYLMDEKNVSVLEVLIALAINWEHEITYDFRLGDRSAIWFWLMIDNLGLTYMDDTRYDPDFVGETLTIWMTREFDKNGNGSPFPVKSGRIDQRKEEIWLQLQQFVLENVDF